jgi:hypothetical protein
VGTGAVGSVAVTTPTDITLAITGVVGASTINSVLYSAEGLGAAASGSVGTVAPKIAPIFNWNVGTTALGNATPNITRSIFGNAASGSVGGWGIVNVPLAGETGTGIAGTASPNITLPITGNEGTADVGSITPETSKIISRSEERRVGKECTG